MSLHGAVALGSTAIAIAIVAALPPSCAKPGMAAVTSVAKTVAVSATSAVAGISAPIAPRIVVPSP